MSPVLKYDVSGSDPGEAAGKEFVQPRPGVYKAKVQKILLAKPEGKDRRIEITYAITDKSAEKANGAWLTDYVNVESEAAVWRLDQLLLAFGITTATSKRKGSFDVDTLLGKDCKIRVKADSYTPAGETEAQYRGKIAAVLPASSDDSEDSEDLTDPDEEPDTTEESGDDDERWVEIRGLEEEEIDDDVQAEIRAKAEEYGIDPDDYAEWNEVVAAVDEAAGEAEPEEEEDATEAVDYSEMEIGELRAELKKRGLVSTGKKVDVIARLEESDSEGPFAS